MTAESPHIADRLARLATAEVVFLRVLAGILILVGLYQWMSIIGVTQLQGAGFSELSGARQWATINLAVAYPAAAVGLWMLASWGLVVWVYAAGSQLLMHTVFAGTFGFTLASIALQILLFAIYGLLHVLRQRAQDTDAREQRAERRIDAADQPVGSGRFTVAARNRIAASIARRRGAPPVANANPGDTL